MTAAVAACTSGSNGYGTTADHVNCALAHTGFNVVPLIMVGLALIALGYVIVRMVRA